jgi:hypothetical protein
MDLQTQCFVEMQSEIQMLRAELQRQRTQLVISAGGNYSADQNLSQNTNHDECVERSERLEAQLETAQAEVEHFKRLAREAAARFRSLRTESVGSPRQGRALCNEWLTMYDQAGLIKDQGQTESEKVSQLEQQLQQAMDDLKSDEEIFADKERELAALKERLAEAEDRLHTNGAYLEAAFAKEKAQQALMLQLQIQLDTLASKNLNGDLFHKPVAANEINVPKAECLALKSRAQTAGLVELLTASQKNDMIGGVNKAHSKRTVNSSPALVMLERVMQSFRARSQILAETLEEGDNVMQKRHFGSTFDVSTDVIDEYDETLQERVVMADSSEDNVSNFSRKGTFKVNKADKAKINLQQTPPHPPSSKSTTIQIKSNASDNKENVCLESKKQIRDLSINIK